jgi:DNA-binding SARP family transcriptional activator
MGVEFCLLGAVEVRVDGKELDIGHDRCRCVLVALVADGSRPVPIEQLMDRVWGPARPHRACDTMYGYLSRLRRALAGTDVGLARQPGGCLLRTDPDTVDLHRFRRLVTTAVPGEAERLARLRTALALWRGEAFAGLDTVWLNNYSGRAFSRSMRKQQIRLTSPPCRTPNGQ